jgi:hypothetical protein
MDDHARVLQRRSLVTADCNCSRKTHLDLCLSLISTFIVHVGFVSDPVGKTGLPKMAMQDASLNAFKTPLPRLGMAKNLADDNKKVARQLSWT